MPVCVREREREIVIMCVEFLTNSLPFADPTFLWNHHRNNSEKYHKFYNKQKGEKGLFTRQSLSCHSPVWSLCFPSSSGTSRSCRSRYSRTIDTIHYVGIGSGSRARVQPHTFAMSQCLLSRRAQLPPRWPLKLKTRNGFDTRTVRSLWCFFEFKA